MLITVRTTHLPKELLLNQGSNQIRILNSGIPLETTEIIPKRTNRFEFALEMPPSKK